MNEVFHLYGLIVGIAIVVAISLIEHQSKKLGHCENCFWKVIFSSLFFGIVGARVWHVATDFYLYENNLQEIFFIWNGGLSIFGGVLGGVVGLYLAVKFFVVCGLEGDSGSNKYGGVTAKKSIFLQFLDIAVFGLPFGQAIGRLGNFVNQELYGKPISDFMKNSIFSVFKIYISPENRLAGYENIEYYHPLFFYEMVLMLCFGAVIYYLNKKIIGTGKLFLIYILYYSVIRFLLDFIRLDKTFVNGMSIGVNQVSLIVIGVLSGFLLFKRRNVL